jgi:spectinomycin phosphotransferase
LNGWEEYIAAAGPVELSQEAIALYNSWWELADIAIYVDLFRRPHERTADTSASWQNLTACLAEV